MTPARDSLRIAIEELKDSPMKSFGIWVKPSMESMKIQK